MTLRKTPERPRLFYVSTLDHIIGVMLPHLDAARAAGFQVEVACRVTRSPSDLRAHADAVHDLPFERQPWHPANLVALARLTRLLAARRPLIVHAHNPTGGLIGRLAATLARVPVRVYTAHGFHFHEQGGRASNFVYRMAETFAGRLLSDGVLVINDEDYEAARRGGVVRPENLFLTGGVGVSEEWFDPVRVGPQERNRVRRELGIPPAAPVLLQVGEMIPRKRHTDTLAAFARIRTEHPDARLVLAGDGALHGRLQDQARTLGVADACHFVGFCREVPGLLAAADLFVFPSVQEGLPCAIQEALCMEVPVVAASVRGCRDLVTPECGRLVPAGDVDALAHASCELLRLPAHARRTLGRAGRARMVRAFGRAACVARWQEIYAALLARKGVAAAAPALPPRPAAESAQGGGNAIVPVREQRSV